MVDTAPVNARAVFVALAEFGAPMQGLTPRDFENLHSIIQIGVSPIRVDIIKQISGLDFETVWDQSMPWFVDEGVPARYVSQQHFIQNKLAVGRPQDLADVEAVRQACAAIQRDK